MNVCSKLMKSGLILFDLKNVTPNKKFEFLKIYIFQKHLIHIITAQYVLLGMTLFKSNRIKLDFISFEQTFIDLMTQKHDVTKKS